MPDLTGQWVAANVSALILGRAKHSNDEPPNKLQLSFYVDRNDPAQRVPCAGAVRESRGVARSRLRTWLRDVE